MRLSTGLIAVGALLTLGSVGGIEQSTSTTTLVQATLLAIVGLALTQCGISLAKEQGDM